MSRGMENVPSDFRPWNARRLALLVKDLGEVAGLAQVGDEGKQLIAEVREYIDSLSLAVVRDASIRDRINDQNRSRARMRRVRAEARR